MWGGVRKVVGMVNNGKYICFRSALLRITPLTKVTMGKTEKINLSRFSYATS